VLIPDLIAHSTNVVEHPELVAERLLRYAGIVGRDSVMAGTDCGFSQSPLAGCKRRSKNPSLKRPVSPVAPE
jgi:5-methyltetrahydropteroyltriglutamate--homocysteine methyltransferase